MMPSNQIGLICTFISMMLVILNNPLCADGFYYSAGTRSLQVFNIFFLYFSCVWGIRNNKMLCKCVL